ICRLEIAMNNALGVSCIKPIGNLDRQWKQQFGFERTSCDAVLQRHAIKKFHGDKRLISVFADLVDSADVGMVQRRGRSCLSPKTFERLRVLGYFFRKKL